jgi:hypothetical protein
VKQASVTDVGWRVVWGAWGHSPRQTGPRVHFLAPALFPGCCSCAVERNVGSERWCAWCANTRACKWSTSCVWAAPNLLTHHAGPSIMCRTTKGRRCRGMRIRTRCWLVHTSRPRPCWLRHCGQPAPSSWTTRRWVGQGAGCHLSVCGTARKREKIARSHTCDRRATHKTSTTNCAVRKGLTASASARCCSTGPSPSRAASEAIAPPRLHTASLIGLLLQ